MDQIHPVSEDNLRIENQPIPNRKITVIDNKDGSQTIIIL